MAVVAGLAFAALAGCTPRARLCTATTDCASGAACVAGRCQPDRPGVKPSIEAARRLVYRPVDIGYVRRGSASEGGVPAQVELGRGGAVLFLRFEAPLPATARIVEAYLVLRRSDVVDDDPAPVHLHATRIMEPWNGRSTSFDRQPRHVDVAAPVTTVEPGGPALVRLDVRELVRLWTRHDPRDHGLAVVGDGEGAHGTTFALAPGRNGERGVGPEPVGTSGVRSGDGRSSPADGAEPYLELYVR